MKEISIQYFALFRDARGRSSESMQTDARTPKELYDELGLGQTFPFDERRLKVALNDEFSTWDTPLSSGDNVVFIAPVAGG